MAIAIRRPKQRLRAVPRRKRRRFRANKEFLLNFMADEAVAAQIAQLQSILPVVVDEESGATARIDTSRMSRVLGDLRREAEAVLIDLGHAPVSRKARVADEASLLDLEVQQPRRRRTSGQTGEPDAASETGRSRKRREW